MKPISTINYLFGIVVLSLMLEAIWVITGQSLGLAVFRGISNLVLVILILKGKNYARVLVTFLCALSGVACLVVLASAVRSAAVFPIVFFLGLGLFYFCSSAFFWRSKVLRALTMKKEVGTVSSV